MCRKYPALGAVVLDLPAAVRHAAPILAKENMGSRVVHRAGNALEDDLGENQWDLVYVSQLLHHFDEPTNRTFIHRIARSLKPRGILAIVELVRPSSPGESGQVGALLDLYFALTSQSGTWSVEEIAGWQRDAGLSPANRSISEPFQGPPRLWPGRCDDKGSNTERTEGTHGGHRTLL